ncbi:MAG TPA: hypothetical protein VLA97_10940 [Nocardioidaceae bacterium]|nr:hypothetical protein [Nocardioidaceae bacterium]
MAHRRETIAMRAGLSEGVVRLADGVEQATDPAANLERPSAVGK